MNKKTLTNGNKSLRPNWAKLDSFTIEFARITEDRIMMVSMSSLLEHSVAEPNKSVLYYISQKIICK